MQVGELIPNSYSNSKNSITTIAIAIGDAKVDFWLDEYHDMYPPQYRAWHAKFIKKHGDDAWVRCAKIAKQDGRDAHRYFVWLLNRV